MNPSETATRRSPIHHLLESRGAMWSALGGGQIAIRFQDSERDRKAMTPLGLCDLSGLAKLGVKGRGAQNWLAGEGIDVPATIYASQPFRDGGRIVRVGADEFFLEEGLWGSSVVRLLQQSADFAGELLRVEHQEATFVLTGERSLEVLSQTCGINFHEAPLQHVVFTRVAGVSCGVFPEQMENVKTFRFWVDPSFAVYLWETLAEICRELGGDVIGAERLFPELLR